MGSWEQNGGDREYALRLDRSGSLYLKPAAPFICCHFKKRPKMRCLRTTTTKFILLVNWQVGQDSAGATHPSLSTRLGLLEGWGWDPFMVCSRACPDMNAGCQLGPSMGLLARTPPPCLWPGLPPHHGWLASKGEHLGRKSPADAVSPFLTWPLMQLPCDCILLIGSESLYGLVF